MNRRNIQRKPGRKIRKFLSMGMAAILALSPITGEVALATAEVDIQAESDICITYKESNENGQNYRTWGSPINSYLYDCGDGTLLRVQKLSGESKFAVEYYDKEYNRLSSQSIDMELNLFGGFYALGGYYYILSGQKNPDESDEVEVYRITKYDKGWNKIASCGLKGANTTIPFDAGSARMTNVGDYLLIRTCHEMYKSSDGKNHQANVTIEVDTNSMEVTDSFYSVMNISYGYVSHSFNQFIQVENNKIVAVDHGDAYPRSIALIKYRKDCSDSVFLKTMYDGWLELGNSCVTTDLFPFSGETGANYTGGSIGGFEISDDAYLVAGNYDIDLESKYRQGRNIYIAKEDKATGKVSVNYITGYKVGEGETSTPHFVSLGENRFILLWYRYKNKKVYYTEIDGNGNRVGDIYDIDGYLSDCVPVLIDNKLVWYVWDDEEVTFYEINTQNLQETAIKTKNLGHDYVYSSEVIEGYITRTCGKCGMAEQVTVPTSFTTWWKKQNGGQDYYSSGYSSRYAAGDIVLCHVNPENGQMTEMEVTSSDTDVINISKSGDDFMLDMEGTGIAEITVRPKYNPGIARTYIFRVGEDASIDICKSDITFESEKIIYTGDEIKPATTVCYKGVKLSKGTDYSVTYNNNINAGTASIQISGAGLFTGTKIVNFKIQSVALTGCSITTKADSYEYNGLSNSPGITVKYGIHKLDTNEYKVTYQNNVNVGTAAAIVEGTGNYTGTVVKEYTIKALDLLKCDISLEYNAAEYTGEACKPLVTVKKGSNLIADENYTVAYSDNTEAGIAKVTITGIKNCTGKIEKTFDIYKNPGTASITSVENAKKGLLIKWNKPATDISGYYVYRNDKNGTYKVVKKITSGTVLSYNDTGANTNGMKYQYKIIPYTQIGSREYKAEKADSSLCYRITAPSISSLENSSSKALLVKWKKNTNISGYQIQYSVNSKFSNSKTVSVKNKTTVSKKIPGLKKGKKYYVRIRSYKTVSSVTCYSQWSTGKSAKVGK